MVNIRNKFDLLEHQIKDKTDVLIISEIKLDEGFLTSQIFMNGFSSPHSLHRNCNGGGIILHIREDIPSKLLATEGDLTEAFLLKWLISCYYNLKRELQSQIIFQH